MKITILGSGTSTGVPIVGCRCPVCASGDPRNSRSRPSILVTHEGRNILVDTSTDLRSQALREGISRIDAVLFTHPHADHVNGIDDLRGFHFINRITVPCYGSAATLETLAKSHWYIFREITEGNYAQLLDPHPVQEAFHLFGLRIVPVPLLHGHTVSTGYRIGNAAYLTDCSGIPETSLPLLRDLDLLIVDGLRFTPHPGHFNLEQALAAAEILKPRRTVLTHLTHEVSYEDRHRLPAWAELAYDGMRLD